MEPDRYRYSDRKFVYMENKGFESEGRIFLSCIKEKHYSNELVLTQHALVYIFSGEMIIGYASRRETFHAGDTVIIPKDQLGRLAKLPMDGLPFKSVSILFPEQLLREHYAAHPVTPLQTRLTGHLLVGRHLLIDGLFHSLMPYLEFQDELPEDLTSIKIKETLAILHTFDGMASRLLGTFHEPGKLDLAGFMEQHFMFNLPLEKFGYLTGRSLTTFKKDFKHIFNTTPGKWLTQKRLERAHYLLSEQRRKPIDVYIETGFENLSHFSYAFKKHFGYPPTNHGQTGSDSSQTRKQKS